mgnify:FL=1
MDFNELTTISGAVVFIKRPAPWNWQALDDKGVICAAPTKRDCQRKVNVMRKYGRYSWDLAKSMRKGFPQ